MSLYHLSREALHKEILKPRIPNNCFTINGFEDNRVARVCLSKSINGCLMALDQKLEGQILYIYKANDDVPVISNEILVANKLVPDAHITGEIWSIGDTELIAIAKIKILYSIGNGYPYKLGKNMAKTYAAKTYDWRYEVVNKYVKLSYL